MLFRMSRPRHPLARAACAVLAVGLLALASVFVMVVAGAVLTLWLARRAFLRLRGEAVRSEGSPAGDVLEGEYRVVRARSELLPR